MNKNNFSLNKLFWGIMFILGAVGLLLNRVNIWPRYYHISLFEIILTIIFIWMILTGIRHRNFFCIIFGLTFLLIQYDKIFHITPITPWTLIGAALLFSIGLTILFPQYHGIHHGSRKYKGFEFVDKGKKVFSEYDGEILNFENSFGSSTKYVNTDSLVCANFENSFGEMKVYFDNAIIKNGVADINLEVSFGAAVLYIPKTWSVENHIKSSFGGIHEQNQSISNGCPTLRLYGEVSFGDVTIVYI